ncbi:MULTISPECIES: hypothetical protein [unclassified Endozoicomonas]|uniref:hypothetical protein n=2 Tax=Endozoicomonas TaxID=305899 RepID=UPI00214867D8|nr:MULTISPECIES: hypothetical protein [unclassified Endozoicomonas]
MDLQEARTFLDTTLSNQLKERSLDHEIRVPCNRQSRKCDVEVYLFNQRESSKQLTEIIRFTVLLNLRPATVNTDSYHSSKIDKSGSNAHSGLEEESDSHCIASMSCPSASVSTTETASLQESDLPDLDQDWMDRVHVYRNQENGDNLVIRDNIVYYTGKSLTVILSLFNTLLFQSGPIDTSDGYYGHFTNAHVLAEALAMGDTIPLLIRDHKLAYVTPQLDATGFALSLAIYVTYVYYWDNLTLDKRKMSGADVRVFYAWKLFANIATKAIGEVAEQRVFANETDSDIHKIKSSLFTSLITALPYGTKLLVTAFTGNNYANHLLMAVPADHLLSCSISVNGVCIQLFFHRILGEADMTIVPATSLEPAKKVTSGLSYIPSAMTQVAIGKALNALGMTVCGGHYIKGAGYALVDGVDKYLIAQGASDLSRYTALTGGALFMSYSNYSFNRAFASGFSYRYAKYLMILASTAFMTLSEFYFHTTILR